MRQIEFNAVVWQEGDAFVSQCLFTYIHIKTKRKVTVPRKSKDILVGHLRPLSDNPVFPKVSSKVLNLTQSAHLDPVRAHTSFIRWQLPPEKILRLFELCACFGY